MKNPPTLHLLPILALASLFIKISGTVSHPVLTGPERAYLGTRVVFRCNSSKSSPPVTYKLMRDGVPVDTNIDFQGGQQVSFILKVTSASTGKYQCKVMSGGSTEVSKTINFSVVIPVSNTRIISEPSPPVVYEGQNIVLSCNVSRGSHLSYTWFFNKKVVTSLTSTLFHLTGNKLVMEEVTAEHAGSYSCMAWSMLGDTKRFSSSIEVQVTVKAYVSKPKISYSISKEGASYHGNVTCWSTKGSPPVNFSLLMGDNEVESITATESLTVWFPVELQPGQNMGVAQCRVKTEMKELMSEPVALEVVPVGGDAKVEVEYLYRADSKLIAARLSCQISRGTFPYISWLFNDSVLPSETRVDSHIQPVLPHFVLSDRRQTLVLTELGPEECGYYRCRVRDSYDESGPWVVSEAVLVQVTATSYTETPPKISMSTIEIIAIVFCCFLLLMMALGGFCVYRMFDHNRAHGHSSTINSEALPLTAPTSHTGAKPADTSFDCDVQNQTTEITV